MLITGIAFLVLLVKSSEATGCVPCTAAYGSASKTDDAEKCDAVKAYVACLEAATVAGEAGCPIAASDATTIESDFDGITTCDLGALCTCQKDYFKEDLASADKCTYVTKRFGCLNGKADSTDCGGSSTVKALADNTQTMFTAFGCTALGADTTCSCEADYVKTDISDDTKKCAALKDEISCLVGKTGAGCDGTTTLIATATAVETAIGSTTGCTKTSNCDCEIAYTKATVATNEEKCIALKTMIKCLQTSVDNGCGASATRMTVGTGIQARVTAITPASECAISTACQCQINFVKADVSAANKCAAITALGTCADAITDTTIKTCDGTTLKDHLKSNVAATLSASQCASGSTNDLRAVPAVTLLVALVVSIVAM